MLEMMHLFGYALGLILGTFFKLNFRSDFLSKIIMRCRIITAKTKTQFFSKMIIAVVQKTLANGKQGKIHYTVKHLLDKCLQNCPKLFELL